MKIKTFNAGRVQATKISKLYIARNDSGSGFNILATVEGHHCDVILKRYLTEHKAKKQLQILNAKLGTEIMKMIKTYRTNLKNQIAADKFTAKTTLDYLKNSVTRIGSILVYLNGDIAIPDDLADGYDNSVNALDKLVSAIEKYQAVVENAGD